jgi:hypothetical protein
VKNFSPLMVVLILAGSAAGWAQSGPPAANSSSTLLTEGPSPSSLASEDGRTFSYAEREALAPDLEEFMGGNTVALAVILAVVVVAAVVVIVWLIIPWK